MPNVANIIQGHNNKILKKKTRSESKCNCNATNKKDCPLPGKCAIESVVYKANVTTPDGVKSYIGLTSGTFKQRYAQHKCSFKTELYQTALSKYVKECKIKNKITPPIKWEIIKQAQTYSPSTQKCNLCIWEKYYIITAEKETLLNSRTELVSTCRHKGKYFLEYT